MSRRKYGANQKLRQELLSLNAELAGILKSDVIFISGPITFGLDDMVRDEVESFRNRSRILSVVLETTGGFIEVAERLVRVFRHHYKEVYFIVPNCAYSAGTVLCMSGDRIYMDYYSVLGPIDPQVEGPDGRLVPATGYLVKYNDLIEKSRNNTITSAEIGYFIQKFDAAELYSIEQSREHSVDLLKEWLVNYKFKHWRLTESKGKRVTKTMKVKRAKEIADILNDTDRWHSHGRGIHMSFLVSDEMKLQIEDFGEDDHLRSLVPAYHGLAIDFSRKMGRIGFVHSPSGLRLIG